MAPTLYLIQRSPPCRTVQLVAKHLNLDLIEVVVDMPNKEHLKPEFLKLNPRHTIPTLVDSNGVSVWESRAIARYLCNKYAPNSSLYPSEPAKRALVDQVLDFELGSFEPAIRNTLSAKAFRGVEPNEEQWKQLTLNIQVLDELIARNNGRYVASADHLTIADLSLLANTTVIAYLDYDLTAYPNVKLWYTTMADELPYYRDIHNNTLEVIMTLTLYLSKTSPPCRTILFVAKQLNLEINQIILDTQNKEQLKPEFLKLNPRHSIPTLVDHDNNGLAIWESRAIARYLCNKYAPTSSLYPTEPAKRAIVDQVLDFELGLSQVIRTTLMAKALTGVEPSDDRSKALDSNLQVLDKLISRNNGRYVASADHLTIADLSLLANTMIVSYVDYDLSAYPNVQEWHQRLTDELPYYRHIRDNTFEALKQKIANSKSQK
ncbi:uncharacterized protein LOC128960059 [Oppia nitens]|uniref:uncharacterized protein LOC128960059 n=1 Tax=Oppia nitens TaxID=1686743 RepID=UPI0023D9C547|nr:uncharacterized protein LOC128960059 [Oppia nitens]